MATTSRTSNSNADADRLATEIDTKDRKFFQVLEMFRQLSSGTSTLETVNDAIIQNEVMHSSFLVDQGLSDHVVRGVGNCLFRAVSFYSF